MAQPIQKTESKDVFLKIEHFFEENKRVISMTSSAILVVAIAIVAITNFYLPSQEKEAQEQLFKSQMYFERDSFKLALNGDGNYLGFLDIIDEAVEKANSYGNEIFCIGGSQIYKQMLPLTKKMYLSVVIGEYEGDAYFPEFDKEEWNLISKDDQETYELYVYERKE